MLSDLVVSQEGYVLSLFVMFIHSSSNFMSNRHVTDRLEPIQFPLRTSPANVCLEDDQAALFQVSNISLCPLLLIHHRLLTRS
jgi:hypothetical protein